MSPIDPKTFPTQARHIVSLRDQRKMSIATLNESNRKICEKAGDTHGGAYRPDGSASASARTECTAARPERAAI
jgi:hypothetical protein